MTDGTCAWQAEATEASTPDVETSCGSVRRRIEDADALQLIQQGETRRALDLLMDRHGDAIYRYCSVLLKDSTLAKDVRQQVFVEAYRDIGSFEWRSSMRTWLFAIARHRAVDAIRRRARTCRADRDVTSEPMVESTPDVLVDAARLHRTLDAILAQLPAPTRTLLVLRYEQGHTYQELAAVLGKAPTALERRAARALLTIRAALVRAGFSSDP